jgi:methanogenic corrinoid protein MtbC1
MRIVGERWHEGSIRIAQEHIVSQLLTNLLGGMMRIYTPADPEATIMTATLSDDLHEFGILASAILATGAGLGVIHLGASVPAKEVSYAAKRSGADVVLISITSLNDRMLREEQLRTVRATVADRVELWVGVNPPGTALSLKGVRVLRNFEELEREIQRLGGKF